MNRENDELIKKFQELFNDEHDDIYFSPGRINLIGEHVDYNGGSCLPIAISLGIYGVAKKTPQPIFELVSHGYNNRPVRITLNNLKYNKLNFSLNYPIGIIKYLLEKHPLKHGFKLYTYSTLPSGAGLSSSAAIELLIAKIIIDYNDIKLTNLELAKLGQRVENEFIGLHSGILDQYVIASAKKDFAINLDTNKMQSSFIPFKIPKDYNLIICNTHKKRSLASSKYNERVGECKSALEIINKANKTNYKTISELDINNLKEYKKILDPTLYLRVKYVLNENIYVKNAIKYLTNNDFISFAKELTKSHAGQRYDYEVSCEELDIIVDNTIKLGAIGARMTGAGFGGCAFFICKTSDSNKIKLDLNKIYQKTTAKKLTYYEIITSNGVSKIK